MGAFDPVGGGGDSAGGLISLVLGDLTVLDPDGMIQDIDGDEITFAANTPATGNSYAVLYGPALTDLNYDYDSFHFRFRWGVEGGGSGPPAVLAGGRFRMGFGLTSGGADLRATDKAWFFGIELNSSGQRNPFAARYGANPSNYGNVGGTSVKGWRSTVEAGAAGNNFGRHVTTLYPRQTIDPVGKVVAASIDPALAHVALFFGCSGQMPSTPWVLGGVSAKWQRLTDDP